MTLTEQEAAPGMLEERVVASMQTSVPAEELINSATAGFLVHRTALLQAEHLEEGLAFSRELVEMLNTSARGYATVLLFQEHEGDPQRVHWLLHLRQPNDYRRLLTLVDHSEKWRSWAELDRLPQKGGGAWDKVFVEGSIREQVFCPQHGVGHAHDAHVGADGPLETFSPPALHQSRVPPEQLLHSANAPAMLHRSLNVRYETREEARYCLFRWAERLTEGLVGTASVFLYEEMWGVQDRLHVLLHLDSPKAYRTLQEFEAADPEIQRLRQVQYAPGTPDDGVWPAMFVPGTTVDTLLVPARGAARLA
jgi:hypothetical protein